jgi:hypothetical protein
MAGTRVNYIFKNVAMYFYHVRRFYQKKRPPNKQTMLQYVTDLIIYYFLWHCSPARAMASCSPAQDMASCSPGQAMASCSPAQAMASCSPAQAMASCSPAQAMASWFTRFLDHTQRRATVDRTPLDEWSIRRRDLYLITHNRQTSMPPVGFEPKIATDERP